MSDDLNEDAPGPSASRFCGRCGGALMAGDAGCAACMQAEADALEQPAIKSKSDRPTFAMAIWLFGLLVASFLPFAILSEDDDIGFMYTMQNAVQIVDTIAVLIFAFVCWKTLWPLIQKAPLHWCLAALPTGIVTMLMATGLIELATMFANLEEFLYSEMAFEAGYGWAFLILTIVIQPAIIEELAFRGIIFDGLRTALSDRETVIVTALMFMVLHLNALAFPHLLIMGLVLGVLRLKTGSLWPCIVLHATHNGMVLVYEYWFYS